MNLAIVSCNLHYPWGGMDKLCTQTAAAALAAGDRVLFAVSPQVASHPAVDKLRSAGALIHHRDGFTQFTGRRSRLRSALQYWLRSPRSLFVALEDFAPDLLVLDQGGPFDYLVEMGLMSWLEKRRVPYVLFCHSNAEDDHIPLALRRTAVELATAARAFLFLSTHNRHLAEQQLGVSLPNANLVRNSIDLPLVPLPWPEQSSVRFATIGRIESKHKGLDVLIAALASALGDVPGWTLDLFGRGADEAATLDRARACGLTDRVRMVGYQSDVGAIWTSHHLLLLPSLREGCPRVMLEAFACARPVLMTDVGGASDWLEPGVNGFLAPRCDLDSLTAALHEAWRDRLRWRDMGAAAARRAALQLDPQPGQTFLVHLRELAARRASASVT